MVIRTKDRPLFVPRALRSVLDQSFQDWHVVLVNDGGDVDLLRTATCTNGHAILPPEKFEILDLQPGRGRSAAFNAGARALQTEFITCLDDDDTWAPDFLSSLLAFHSDTTAFVPCLGGVAARVTALREEIIETALGPQLKIIGEDSLPRSFARGEFFLNPLAYACFRQDVYPVQWMLSRDAVLGCGGFPEDFDVMEDRAFLNRFLPRWRVAILDAPLAFHHRRTQRVKDFGRDVTLNTLDNPSYDWRLFSDLARPGINLARDSRKAEIVRSIAADLLAELNYETSAIWQKVDGDVLGLRTQMIQDFADLRLRIEEVQGNVALQSPRIPEQPKHPPQPVLPKPPEGDVAFDIWEIPAPDEVCAHVTPGVTFVERLTLSFQSAGAGLLMRYARPETRLELQVPRTGGWTALEISLEGLAPAGMSLQCHLQVAAREGYLFETALNQRFGGGGEADRHHLSDYDVHRCPDGGIGVIERIIPAAWLAGAREPKFSIILPREALNFQFLCRHLRLLRVAPI